MKRTILTGILTWHRRVRCDSTKQETIADTGSRRRDDGADPQIAGELNRAERPLFAAAGKTG